MARDIPERQTFPWTLLETLENLPDYPEKAGIGNALTYHLKENPVRYGIEELAHIAFQGKCRTRMITRDFPDEAFEPPNARMSALPIPAGIGIMNECILEKRVKRAEKSLIENPIANARLMDMPQFRIADEK